MALGSIAVIGGGPSGATALESFINAGFTDITVFERHRTVGGTWNLDEDLGFENPNPIPGIDRDRAVFDAPRRVPPELIDSDEPVLTDHSVADKDVFNGSSLYPQVETNVLAELMAFSDKPLPPIHPENTLERFGVEDAFRNHDVIRDYVLKLYKGRDHYVKLNTTVEKAWQPKGPGGKWKLILRNRTQDKDQWYTKEFDFLYVASGRFSVPNIPDFPGLREAVHEAPPGSILHAKTFRDPELYSGKKVLVVGAGFSNVDIIQLLRKGGAQLPLHLSLRSVLPLSVPGFAQPWIDAHQGIAKIAVKSSKLQVEFLDGEVLHDVDNIILGTGYRYSYPFLEEYLNQFDGGIISPGARRTQNLFWSTWWKNDASLAVAGSITDSVFWRFIENQGKATAGLWKRDRSEWPTVEESDAWEAKRNAKGLKDFHLWWPHFNELFTNLAKWGNYDPGDVDIYLPLFNKGFELKGRFWKSLSDDWLAKHPEDQERYDKVFQFLSERIITRVGL